MKKILILIIVLLVVGCAARKVNKSEVEVKQEITSTTKDTVTQTNEKTETEIDMSFMYKKTFIPMNESLPFIVDGKEYKNVRIKTTKIKKGVTISKKDNSVLKAAISSKKTIQTQVETKDKKQERHSNTFSIFYWIVIAIVSYIVYDYFKNK